LVEMRVALGIHACQSADDWDRGIARYVREHSHHLLISGGAEYEVWVDPDLPPPIGLADFCGYGVIRTPPMVSNRPFSTTGLDLFHIMSPFEMNLSVARLFPAPVARSTSQYVVTLYDLIPLRFEAEYLSRKLPREMQLIY
jgi:hypothetical protein